MKKELKGIVAVLVTPYKDNEEVDYAGLEYNINWQISKGVHAILVLGGTGEYVSLRPEERFRITETAVKAVGGRVPLVIGIGAEATRDAIAYAQKAEQCGADAVMLGHPYYCGASWEMLREHYKRVCGATKLPVILYNNPYTTGVDLGLEHTIQLLNEIPNLEYVKDSTGSIQRTRNIRLDGPAKVKLLAGWDDMGLEAMLVGAQGWICVGANACPELCVDVYEKVQAGDYAGAWKTYEKLLPLLRYLEDGGRLIPAAKYAASLRGCVGGKNRGPHLELPEDDRKMLKQYLKSVDLL